LPATPDHAALLATSIPTYNSTTPLHGAESTALARHADHTSEEFDEELFELLATSQSSVIREVAFPEKI
jgi:hypothetical protein